jgi:2-keto-4-pentenoate hydratase
VHSVPTADWRDLRLDKLKLSMTVNGKVTHDKIGGHPINDPLGVAVVLANIWREKSGVRAGQFVTCGSYMGCDFIHPGDTCTVAFEGLGHAEVTFAKGPPEAKTKESDAPKEAKSKGKRKEAKS